MGFDLSRGRITDPENPDFLRRTDPDDPGFSANIAGWSWLLRTGEDRGWEPAGTLPPDDWASRTDREWEGDYGSNVGQRVTAEDAAAWGEAIASGMPYADESERWNEILRRFVAYCRGGGFCIF